MTQSLTCSGYLQEILFRHSRLNDDDDDTNDDDDNKIFGHQLLRLLHISQVGISYMYVAMHLTIFNNGLN